MEFVGKPVTPQLIVDIEKHILKRLIDSGINEDKFPISVKGVPLGRGLIAVRVALKVGQAEYSNLKIDMIASTADGTIQLKRQGYSR